METGSLHGNAVASMHPAYRDVSDRKHGGDVADRSGTNLALNDYAYTLSHLLQECGKCGARISSVQLLQYAAPAEICTAARALSLMIFADAMGMKRSRYCILRKPVDAHNFFCLLPSGIVNQDSFLCFP
jgi:hypothetical protein